MRSEKRRAAYESAAPKCSSTPPTKGASFAAASRTLLGAVFGAALSTAVAASPAAAQDDGGGGVFSVVVKVNETAVTGYDVQQRARLIQLSAGSREVPELQQTALSTLVDDALKLQEAERRGVSLTDDQLATATEDVAARNNLTSEQFLANLEANGVERATFMNQLRAELSWNRLLRGRYGSRAQPTEGEIEAMVDASRADAERMPTRYRMEQLLVPVSPSAPRNEVRSAFERAERARARISGCGGLRPIADAVGGTPARMGLLTLDEMPPPVREALPSMNPGQALRPLRSRQGFHVIVYCRSVAPEAMSESQAMERVRSEKLNRFSESYLEELRRDSMIERRL